MNQGASCSPLSELINGGMTYMVKDGNSVVSSVDSEPLVYGLLAIISDHDIHSKLGQLPTGTTIWKLATKT